VKRAAVELARLMHNLDDPKPADLAREVARFLEQLGEIELALGVMEAARQLRPTGPFIIEKCNEYRRILDDQEKKTQ
jgi:hypothetical protein